MPSSPLTDTPVPDLDYANDPPADITAAVTDLESYTCPRFASSTERDLKWSAWAAATGDSLEDGMSCWVADHFEDRIDGAWVQRDSSSGLVVYGYTTSTSVDINAEARVAGTHNKVMTLVPGRAYEAVATGRVNNESAGLVQVLVRAARNATPTTASSPVADVTVYCPAGGGTGQVSFNTGGRPFQVGTASSGWQLHLFAKKATGGPNINVLPDARGVFSLAVYDRGPATTDVPTI